MKSVIVGYGSIGQRHAALLKELGHDVTVVSRRTLTDLPYALAPELSTALIQSCDLIIVANETSEHEKTLRHLSQLNYRGFVLVEKPIYSRFDLSLSASCKDIQNNTYIGYNLRFHPLVQMLKQEFEKSKLLSAWLYCGQYLPNWRTNRNYKESYSSSKEKGGGVIRDLSHEIDLIHWLIPHSKLEYARGGHWSNLATNVDDHFILNFSDSGKAHVGLHLNCVDRLMQRNWIFNFEHDSVSIDINRGVYRNSTKEIQIDIDRNESYRKMLTALLDDKVHDVCGYKEAVRVCETIDQAEKIGLSHG